HRYETALQYRDEQRGIEAAEYVLAYLANMEEEGVVILPTHRLVRGPLPARLDERLRETFEVEPLPAARRRAGEIDCVLPDRRLPRGVPGGRADAREVDLLLPEARDRPRPLARRAAVGVSRSGPFASSPGNP